jgi:hypothetical protein
MELGDSLPCSQERPINLKEEKRREDKRREEKRREED